MCKFFYNHDFHGILYYWRRYAWNQKVSRCRGDDKIKLNDGAYKVFFNAADYAKIENDEEKNFFKFLSGHIVFIYYYNALKSIMPRSRSPAENEKLLLFSFPL